MSTSSDHYFQRLGSIISILENDRKYDGGEQIENIKKEFKFLLTTSIDSVAKICIVKNYTYDLDRLDNCNDYFNFKNLFECSSSSKDVILDQNHDQLHSLFRDKLICLFIINYGHYISNAIQKNIFERLNSLLRNYYNKRNNEFALHIKEQQKKIKTRSINKNLINAAIITIGSLALSK